MNPILIKEKLKEFLEEDLGAGDITTKAAVRENEVSEAVILAKEKGVLAGSIFISELLELLNPGTQNLVKLNVSEGEEFKKGQEIVWIKTKTRTILGAERTILNILTKLCGIATFARKVKKLVEDLPVEILDTRKTTPGFRFFEKYAVKVGGGKNHRMGLYDAILIKDNHIAASGGVREALKRVKQSRFPPSLKVEIEVTSLIELKEVLNLEPQLKPDIVMLDNMNLKEIRKAVKMAKGKVLLEASGGITEKNVRKIAEAGVDFISMSALITKAKPIDLSLEILK